MNSNDEEFKLVKHARYTRPKLRSDFEFPKKQPDVTSSSVAYERVGKARSRNHSFMSNQKRRNSLTHASNIVKPLRLSLIQKFVNSKPSMYAQVSPGSRFETTNYSGDAKK